MGFESDLSNSMSVGQIETLPRVRRVSLKDIERFMKKTDCQKTLEALKKAGSSGVHSFDLNYIVGTIRVAARINDLKAQGYVITSVYEKRGDSHGCRYFLTSSSNVTTRTSKKPVKVKPVYIFDEERQVYVMQ